MGQGKDIGAIAKPLRNAVFIAMGILSLLTELNKIDGITARYTGLSFPGEYPSSMPGLPGGIINGTPGSAA